MDRNIQKMKKIISILIATLMFVGCSDGKKTLHVYSWADYIDQTVLTDFERDFNCHVCIDTFDSNESMIAKLRAGAEGYDICIPSSYMVDQMAQDNMIDPIDKNIISNVINNFDHSFDSQIIDPNLSYSVPFAVTYAGLMCLTNKIKGTELSWDIFSDTSLNQKMSFLDDIRETIGIGLMYNGFSINSENKDEIEVAINTILKWRKNIRKFDAESYKTEVANKSLYVGHGYSSDAFQVILGDDETLGRDDICFILPKEGFSIAWDEMVIMKKSENKELAYNFINFMYKKENALKNMIHNISPVPHKFAISELPDNLKKTIILDRETSKKGQVIKRFKNKETIDLYNLAWDRIKASLK